MKTPMKTLKMTIINLGIVPSTDSLQFKEHDSVGLDSL